METSIQVIFDHEDPEIDEGLVVQAVERVLHGEAVTADGLAVILTGHETVLELNREYLDHDYHTDVLAFPLSEDDETVEGELYIDLDTARERHVEFEASYQEEVLRYVIHGMLHLCGHTDDTPEGKEAMKDREDQYLAAVIRS